MNLEYAVQINDHVHRIRIDVPGFCDESDLERTRQFAIVTAMLVHAGYLPAGTVHGIV